MVLHLPGDARSIDVDRHIARRHTTSDVPLLFALMRQLATLHPGSGARLPHIEQLAMDAVRLCWPTHPITRREPMALWERRVRRHVDRNLDDHELSAASIARQYGVSTRFVHMVFTRTGETAGSYILERRLAAAARDLRSAAAARITDIAFNAGFADLSHFSRVFRRRFGLSPRDYRRKG
jgi:AraC-like DNA-binding protein